MKKVFDYLNRICNWALKPTSFFVRLPRMLLLLIVFYIILLCFALSGALLMNIVYITFLIPIITLLVSIIAIFIPFNKKIISVALFLCKTLIFLSFALWSATFLPSRLNMKLFPFMHQFPLGGLDGMVLTGDDFFYVSLPVYERIQKYTIDGLFVKSWTIKSAGGKYDLWKDDEGNVNVAVSRTSMHLIFDIDGKLISQEKIKDNNEWNVLISNVDPLFAQDKEGNRYILYKNQYYPRVVKVDSEGEKSILIQDPIHLFLVRSPIPTLLYFFLGLIPFLILKARYKCLI